jgi:pterin-4a-carbinolamine dehydratase
LFETDFTLVFFRHAFITDFITNKVTSETTDAEIKEISDKMGHSPEMFRGYKWIKSGAKGDLMLGTTDGDGDEDE